MMLNRLKKAPLARLIYSGPDRGLITKSKPSELEPLSSSRNDFAKHEVKMLARPAVRKVNVFPTFKKRSGRPPVLDREGKGVLGCTAITLPMRKRGSLIPRISCYWTL